MPDRHPEIDKNRPGKRFVLTYFPSWDWYNTESLARTVADKAQEVIDALVQDYKKIARELFELQEHLSETGKENDLLQ